MNKMVQTVILLSALVLANCQEESILKGDDLSINIVPKYGIESDSETGLTETPLEEVMKGTESIRILEIGNKIAEFDNDQNVTSNIEDFQMDYNINAALLLTPMLEKGLNEEARNASRVDPSIFLGFESYSGFFTVNKKYNSNVFFWYFPVEDKPVNETPWIIWLQGGPGASSLFGLFEEIGPFQVDNKTLINNEYTWLQNHSLLFIDNPVGSGFSFTEHNDGFVSDIATYSKHLFSTVHQFLQVFPELKQAPLFVAGESYAGKYVPALAMELHMHKNNPGQGVNLQGIMIGNALVDPVVYPKIPQAYYYFGLLEKEQMEIIEPLVNALKTEIANHDTMAAQHEWININSLLLRMTNQSQIYNFLKDEIPLGRFSSFLHLPEVKKALHVGEIKFAHLNYTTYMRMAPDFLTTTKPLFEKLLEHYPVLAYCGHLDLAVPCVFNSENYRTWQWSGARNFLNAPRYPMMVNNRRAGYSKTGGRLTEVVVRGAGHMVPTDVPAEAQALVTRWTHGEPLEPRSPLLEGTFTHEFLSTSSAGVYL